MELWQWHCQNRREKKNCYNWFVAMPLPKLGENFCDNCGNAITEIGGKFCDNCGIAKIQGGIKEKSVMSTIFLQQITCDQLLLVQI